VFVLVDSNILKFQFWLNSVYLQVKVRPHREQRFFLNNVPNQLKRGSLYFVRWYLSDYLCKIWGHAINTPWLIKSNSQQFNFDVRWKTFMGSHTHYVVNILSTMRWFLHFFKNRKFRNQESKNNKKNFLWLTRFTLDNAEKTFVLWWNIWFFCYFLQLHKIC